MDFVIRAIVTAISHSNNDYNAGIAKFDFNRQLIYYKAIGFR
jgi:hypothetical protein